MFDRIFDFVVAAWVHLSPGAVIDPYETGGVLRLGKYHRTISNGFHWKWPLVERVIEIVTCMTTLRLPPQTLTTKDGVGVVVTVIIKYEIKDVESYITKIWDQNDVLVDVSMGAVRSTLSAATYDELLKEPPEAKVLEVIRKEVNQFGFKVHKITFTDLGKVRSFRLIQPHGKDLAN